MFYIIHITMFFSLYEMYNYLLPMKIHRHRTGLRDENDYFLYLISLAYATHVKIYIGLVNLAGGPDLFFIA